MFTTLILFILSSGHPCIANSSRPTIAVVEFEPQPRTSEIVRCNGPRCCCRTSEINVVIDGVPIETECPMTASVNHKPLVFRSNTPWLVTIPADHFMWEIVFSGDWIQTRPRLRH